MFRAFLIAVLPLLAGSLGAQEAKGADKYFKLEAVVVPARVQAGQKATLELRLTMQPGWHLYGAKDETGQVSSLAGLEAGPLTKVGKLVVPDGEKHEIMEGFVSWWLQGSFVLKQQLQVPAGTGPGKVALAGKLAFMACTAELCDPPTSTDFTATVEVVAPAGDPAAGGEPSGDPSGMGPSGMDLPDMGLPGQGRLQLVGVRVEPTPLRAGELATVTIELEPEIGWHVYGAKESGSPTTMRMKLVDGVAAEGPASVPDGLPHDTAGLESWWIGDRFEIVQKLRVHEGVAPGELKLEARVAFMACTEMTCDPADELGVPVALQVEAGAPRAAWLGGAASDGAAGPVSMAGGSGETADASEIGGGSVWELIVLAFLAGLLALVMPCTYPMIPITVSFFTKQANDRGGKVLSLALAYGGGIVLSFIAIGALVGDPIVRIATHWITNLVIGGAFVVFGMSLLGYITIQPPSFLMDAAGKASRKGGFAGVFLMGLTLVITSFTCTAPFVGSLIAFAAKGGDYTYVVLGMGVFGLTMAVPFVFLSLVPGKLAQMPRAGEWMNTVKVFLGFVEIAAAIKFLSNADVALHEPLWISPELFFWSWVLLFGLATLYLFGLIDPKGKAPGLVKARGKRLGFAMLTLVFCGYLSANAISGPSPDDFVMAALSPPLDKARHELYKDDFERAVAKAKTGNKLVLINFTGFT